MRKKKDDTVLTPKGYYFLNYCKKIANNELKENDKIQAYEDSLRVFVDMTVLASQKPEVKNNTMEWEELRLATASILVEIMKDMELKEY